MPEQTVHASQFYKWNSPSSYPKVTNSKNFWLKNRRTSGNPTMDYIYLGDVDLMIKTAAGVLQEHSPVCGFTI